MEKHTELLNKHTNLLDKHMETLSNHQAGFEILFRNMSKMEERLDLELKRLKNGK